MHCPLGGFDIVKSLLSFKIFNSSKYHSQRVPNGGNTLIPCFRNDAYKPGDDCGWKSSSHVLWHYYFLRNLKGNMRNSFNDAA